MPEGRLYVLIRGIEMAYDAKVLIGLFYDGKRLSSWMGTTLPLLSREAC